VASLVSSAATMFLTSSIASTLAPTTSQPSILSLNATLSSIQ
jgi:hypothetical protein